jgi:hypothetical protein
MKYLPAPQLESTLAIALTLLMALAANTGRAEPAAESAAATITSQNAQGEIAGWRSFHEDDAKTGDVWTLTDGVLLCKGAPRGYLYTEKPYTNFVMQLEWRWPPEGKTGNGGVLIRTTGPDKIWPKSLEAQINHAQAGDFWGLDGYSLAGPPDRMKTLETEKFGRLTNLKKTADVEKPPGQWNSYEITADGETVTLKINGQVVNRAAGCEVVPGTIVLTAEGDEIHFRNVRIQELSN